MAGSLMVFEKDPMAVKHSVLTAGVARLMAVRAWDDKKEQIHRK